MFYQILGIWKKMKKNFATDLYPFSTLLTVQTFKFTHKTKEDISFNNLQTI